MSATNTIIKISVLALLCAVVPVMALNFIMPRLGIATADLEFGTDKLDITVAAMDNNSVTLDFWIPIGLPRNDPDAPYYLTNGSVDRSNLNTTSEVIIPKVGMEAMYKGFLVGTGGSPRQIVLNVEHPVEFLHLYLRCDRGDESGLMYLFTDLVSGGLIESLLGSLTGSGGGGGLDADMILGGLDLTLTAYMGGAPVRLANAGDLLFGGGLVSIPVTSNVAPVSLAPAMTPSTYSSTNISYVESRDGEIGSMERLIG
nr:hypothetical protein [Candidatus Sigynarchaeota archaeon]